MTSNCSRSASHKNCQEFLLGMDSPFLWFGPQPSPVIGYLRPVRCNPSNILHFSAEHPHCRVWFRNRQAEAIKSSRRFVKTSPSQFVPFQFARFNASGSSLPRPIPQILSYGLASTSVVPFVANKASKKSLF